MLIKGLWYFKKHGLIKDKEEKIDKIIQVQKPNKGWVKEKKLRIVEFFSFNFKGLLEWGFIISFYINLSWFYYLGSKFNRLTWVDSSQFFWAVSCNWFF
jgi:hypothetical protein